MRKLDFWYYNKEAEEPGGDYWKFFDATIDDLKRDDISLNGIQEVMNEIANAELKQKMIRKIHDLIMENGIFEITTIYALSLFTKEETKEILENEVDRSLDKYASTEENLKYYSVNIENLILAIRRYVDDHDWKLSMNRRILDRIKKYSNKFLVRYVEKSNKYVDIY